MARAEAPSMIGYQGSVYASGTPFTGVGHFKFALVSPDGARTFWSHDGTSTAGSPPTTSVDLPVEEGRYSVRLGDLTVAGMTLPVSANLFSQTNDVRVRVWFSDTPNGFQLLTPDDRLASVGYALTANQLTGLLSPTNLPVGGITERYLANRSVSAAKLGNGAVTATSLADGAISTAKLTNGAVTAAKIANGAVGPQQLDPGYGLWKQLPTGLSYDQGNIDIGVGGNRGTAPLHVTSGPAYLNSVFESENSYGTWLSIANTSAGGTNWLIQSTGSQSVTGAGAGNLAFSLSLARGVTTEALLTLNPLRRVGINAVSPLAALHVQTTNGSGDAIIVGGNPRAGGTTSLSLGLSSRQGGFPYLQGVSSSGSSYGVLKLNPDGGNVDLAPYGVVSLAARGGGVGIGLGDASPTAPLHVDSRTGWVNTVLDSTSTSGTWLDLRNFSSQGTNWTIASSAADTWPGLTPGALVVGTTQLRATMTKPCLILTPAGNAGIGMTNPTAPLHVGTLNGVGAALRLGGDPSVPSTTILDLGMTQGTKGNTYIQGVSSSGSDYGLLMINPNGGRTQVGPRDIQQSDTTLLVHQDPSSITCATFARQNGALLMKVGGGSYALTVDGEAHKTNGNPFWNTTSDERLKTEIEPLHAALCLVNQVRPVTFRYAPAHRAANPGIPDTQQYGVIAQEFAKVFPDFVSTNRDGFLSVNTSPLIFANTAAIQELHAQVKSRDVRIQTLESQVAALQKNLAALETTQTTVASLVEQVKAMQKQLAAATRPSDLLVAAQP